MHGAFFAAKVYPILRNFYHIIFNPFSQKRQITGVNYARIEKMQQL